MSLEQRCETCGRPKLLYAKTNLVICPYCDPRCENCNHLKKDHIHVGANTCQWCEKCSLMWKWNTELWYLKP